jgi:hypothetical protein
MCAVPARHVLSAVTAGTLTALVLMLRWLASRPRSRRQAGAARDPASAGPAQDTQADEALREAERHVREYWQRLRTQHPPHD